MKYPKELRDEAIKWFGLPTDSEDTVRQIADRIYAMRKVRSNEPRGLKLYSSIEIAEIVKDIDRNA